jgi:hypothetical protein
MSALGATFPLLGLSGGIRVAPHTFDTVLTDEIGASYGLSVIRAQPVTASDVIHAHGALTVYYGAVVTEHVLLSLAQTPTFKYHLTAADTAFIHAVLNPAVPALLAEHVGVALAQQAQQAISVIEGLGLHPLLAPMMLYGRTITETIHVASVLGRFFGGDLTDGIHIASVMGGIAAKGGLLAETIGVASGLTPRLVLRVTAEDSITLDDASILRMAYAGNLARTASRSRPAMSHLMVASRRGRSTPAAARSPSTATTRSTASPSSVTSISVPARPGSTSSSAMTTPALTSWRRSRAASRNGRAPS